MDLTPNDLRRQALNAPTTGTSWRGGRALYIQHRCGRHDVCGNSPVYVKVFLSKALRVLSFPQLNSPLTTDAVGVLEEKHRSSMTTQCKVLLANGVADVHHWRAFSIVLSNFGTKPQQLPKGLFVSLVSKDTWPTYPSQVYLRQKFFLPQHTATLRHG